jgi:hypothetical protein
MAGGKAARLQQHQFVEAFEEVVLLADALAPAQCVRGGRIGAGRAAEAEIDAAGIERLQHLEAFGHHQWGVVRQHHAAGSDAHVFCHRRDLPDHDVGVGTGDRRHVVVFGHPIAPEAQAIGVSRQIQRIAQGLGAGRAGRDRRKVEDGKRGHGR